ncbi:Ig-like domain repeat protein [Aeromicrobium sp. UC242_57]|uniref:Ig-like domain repeat protein n=1 Tax=Aeromicrobium sp. UC242_57 TaxID=3374624 RepID=UPI0037A409E2
MLEQQWQTNPGGPAPSRPYLQLGLSKNVTYTYDANRAEGDRIIAVRINGEALDLAKDYKVATFSFLAAGGDNFRAFKKGVNTDTALVDRDGWEKFFEDNSPVSPSYAKHAVQVTSLKDTYRVGATVSYTLSKIKLGSLGSPADKTVSSKLFYGDGQSVTLPSKAVVNDSAALSFALPAGASGAMRVESTVYPNGTKIVVPLNVTGASVTADAVAGTYGDDVAIAVTVSGPEETPTGEVAVKKGDTVVGTATLANGTATVTVDSEDLGAGASNLTVVYAGDASLSRFDRDGRRHDRQGRHDGVRRRACPDEGQRPGADRGHGGFGHWHRSHGRGDDLRRHHRLGSATVSNGSATVSTDVSGLTVGRHELSVAYSGDGNHEASTTAVDVNVLKGTAPLTATSAGAAYGTAAKVRVTGGPGASGLLYLANGDDMIAVGFLQDGVATVSLGKTVLKPGSYTLDVYYGGSASFDSAQTTVGVTITKGATTTRKVSVSPTKIVKNRTKATVTVSVAGAGFTVDGGKVTLRASGKTDTGTVKAGKVKIKLGKFTSTGSKRVTVTYAGNEVAKSSSTSFTVKVVKK